MTDTTADTVSYSFPYDRSTVSTLEYDAETGTVRFTHVFTWKHIYTVRDPALAKRIADMVALLNESGMTKQEIKENILVVMARYRDVNF